MSLALSDNLPASNIHLPADVWRIIIGKLAMRDVVMLSKVCRSLGVLANEEGIWKNFYVNFYSEKSFNDWAKDYGSNQHTAANKKKFQITYQFNVELERKRREFKKNYEPPPPPHIEIFVNSIVGIYKICFLEAVSVLLLGIAAYKQSVNRNSEAVVLVAAAAALPAIAYYTMDKHARDNALLYGTIITLGATAAAGIPAYVVYKIIATIVNAILFR